METIGSIIFVCFIAYLSFEKIAPKVKKTIVLFITISCLQQLNAQNSSKIFSAYKLVIPGSALQHNMLPIAAGSFLMGSSSTEKHRNADEGPQRTIAIPAFWMGAFEVSRDEFDVFFNDNNISENSKVDAITRPSPQYIDYSLGMGKEGGYPVNSLSQFAALMYCRWLYDKTGIFYRLPSEAEWEYACRAGSTTAYFFGDDTPDLGKYAWYKNNSDNKFHQAGLKMPNTWGLYDILGNVSEWTLDHYDEKRLVNWDENKNPVFVEYNKARYPKVLRGGGFKDEASELRSASRLKSDPILNRRDPQIPKSKWWLTDGPGIGFRIVRPLKQPGADDVNEFFKQYLGK